MAAQGGLRQRRLILLRRTLLASTAAVLAACSAAPSSMAPSSMAPSSAPPAPPTATGAPSGPADSSPTPPPATLAIYAAASLKNAMAKAKEVYEAANRGTVLNVSTDSSAALETKIEQGAPVDVLLSADTTQPKKLVDRGFASGSVVNFAGSVLIVIVPTANPAGIQSPADLAKPGIKVIACGERVPIQQYANQLVSNLARQAGYPGDFAAAYARNIVSREMNVAALVTKVELGEGDAGIVYATDAKASTKVTSIPVPAAANVPTTYGGVVVRASSNQAAATAFLGWLASPDGQAVLSTFGFQPPPG